MAFLKCRVRFKLDTEWRLTSARLNVVSKSDDETVSFSRRYCAELYRVSILREQIGRIFDLSGAELRHIRNDLVDISGTRGLHKARKPKKNIRPQSSLTYLKES